MGARQQALGKHSAPQTLLMDDSNDKPHAGQFTRESYAGLDGVNQL